MKNNGIFIVAIFLFILVVFSPIKSDLPDLSEKNDVICKILFQERYYLKQGEFTFSNGYVLWKNDLVFLKKECVNNIKD